MHNKTLSYIYQWREVDFYFFMMGTQLINVISFIRPILIPENYLRFEGLQVHCI